jgi:hypothetical protein
MRVFTEIHKLWDDNKILYKCWGIILIGQIDGLNSVKAFKNNGVMRWPAKKAYNLCVQCGRMIYLFKKVQPSPF